MENRPKRLNSFHYTRSKIENAAPQVASALPGGVRLHLKKSKHLLKPIPGLEGVVVFASGKAYAVNVPVSQSGKGSHTQ